MVNFNAYLQSIANTYAKWWECYTITDVVGQRDEQKKQLPLFDFGLMVETVKQEKEEKTERLKVIEGLRKYAANHVLLIGRPGSGKSTALIRLLKETSPQTPLLRGEGLNSPHSLAGKGAGGLGQIPILVELRFYKTSIIDLIRDFLKRHQLLLEISEIERLLFAGQFLLLVDGVNELPSEAARQDLQKFRQNYQQTTPMIFTTRDLGVGGDLGIEKKLQMQPLTETQMRDFVCGYLPQGEELLKQLSGRLRELGETPLLLMMLCWVFVDNQNKVPSNLGSVFRRFTEIYDKKLKQDIPVTDESRRWWKRLLQHLAWVMTQGGSKTGELKTEILVAIPIQEARDILTKFLKEQDYHQPRDAEKWLDDLLKHHLIQLGAENQIQFRHQLLQEYYAAERLLEEIPKLSDRDLQWEYLNYLKWTEPVALMMHLLNVETQNFASLRLVKLALEVDWQLGARLAGEVKEEWQGEAVGLIDGLELPLLLKIRLLEISKSDVAISSLIKMLQNMNNEFFEDVIFALVGIGSNAAINALIEFLQYEYEYEDLFICGYGLISLEEIDNWDKIIDIFRTSKYDIYHVKYIFGKNKIIDNKVTKTIVNEYLLHDKNQSSNFSKNEQKNINYQHLISESIENLKHDDANIRKLAFFTLRNICSKEAIKVLIGAIQNEDNSSVLHTLSICLRNIVSEPDIPVLIQLLQHEHFLVRLNAVCALGRIGGDAAIPGLVIALEDRYEDVRSDAALAIQDIGSDAAIPGLIKLMKKQYAPNLIEAFEKVQQHLKYYKPIPKPTMSKSTSQKYDLAMVIRILEQINQGVEKMSEQSQNSKYSFGNSELI